MSRFDVHERNQLDRTVLLCLESMQRELPDYAQGMVFGHQLAEKLALKTEELALRVKSLVDKGWVEVGAEGPGGLQLGLYPLSITGMGEQELDKPEEEFGLVKPAFLTQNNFSGPVNTEKFWIGDQSINSWGTPEESISQLVILIEKQVRSPSNRKRANQLLDLITDILKEEGIIASEPS